MKSHRLEAYTDAVIAILITIMVLELKVPHAENFEGLKPLVPIFISYVLSFIYLGIYWNNHHHMFHLVEKVTGPMLWWNQALLFVLSLVPFTTGWMGENHFGAKPTALYGIILLGASLMYWGLQQSIIKSQGESSLLKKAVGDDLKGKTSPIIYLLGILSSFFMPWLAFGLYTAVALMWLVPDRRMEEVDC
jgi:uncharacterized membrane protein